jgi:CBS domain-containing protein
MNVATILNQKGGGVFSDFMTKTVMTAGEADTINQLMSEMTIRQFRHMPVVEKDRLIGLVSFGDLVKIQIAESEMETAATREYTGLGG